ncbi:unnamed protein product [Aspergillus oryzae]|uniref:Unnamed protein product n=2 Tax=Aspergillus oryzae TaxID=5062 RepID=A0AAN4YED3_ASPOZ|nr:unnamed protein product [Aspergillus oryzae]GMF84451.1 unnamed protein product [Aspergillus oryzae]GMG05379.1 unnamed protein product [Aspergillus oryzae]GMG23864.1 unnamed protein product [Aspergillus oryzae]GMG44353.1 unnamed protein product [Aspergillus oryzae var. brunneus]
MKNQKSILGFFQKSSPSTPSTARNAEPASSPAQRVSEQRGAARGSVKSDKKKSLPQLSDLSPVPSSDLVEPEEDEGHIQSDSEGEDDDEKIFRPGRKSSKISKRRKLSPESDDEFEQGGDDAGYSDEGVLLIS